jgi:hypothetical protein
VFVRASGDEGRTWGPLRRVNDDARGNGRHQYLPRISSSPAGRLDVIFYDRRNDDSNIRSDVYYTSSSDGGRSFTENLRVTRESSHSRSGPRYPLPSAQGLVDFGSRLALWSQRRTVVAAWTDSRNSRAEPYQDIFVTRVDLGSAA